MAIWSEYMREKDRLEKAECVTCDGYGFNVNVPANAMGLAQCDACKGTGYLPGAAPAKKLPLIQYDARSVDKEYLSDGLYIRFDGYQIWLTAENGVEVTDQVALEPSVLFAFEDYLKRMRAKAAGTEVKEG